MPVLNVDVNVNPAQLSSAAQSLQYAASTGAVMSGDNGLAGGFLPPPVVGMNVGGGRAPFMMPNHPSQAFIQNGPLAFSAMTSGVSQSMAQVMADLNGNAQRSMQMGVGSYMPEVDDISAGKKMMGAGLKTGISMGAGALAASWATKALGGRGGAIGSIAAGLIGYTGAGYLIEGLGINKLIDWGVKKDATTHESKAEYRQVLGRMIQAEQGARTASLFGFANEEFDNPAAIKAFHQGPISEIMGRVSAKTGVSQGMMAQQIVASSHMGSRLRMDINKLIGEKLNRVDGSYNEDGATSFQDFMTGKVSLKDASLANITRAKENSNVFDRIEKMISTDPNIQAMNYNREKYNISPDLYLRGSTSAMMSAAGVFRQFDPWAGLGSQIGAQQGLSAAEGRNGLGYYGRRQAGTDLGMRNEFKNAAGGTMGIAARYASNMMNMTQIGGEAFSSLALFDKGIMPTGNLQDSAGQFAGAYAGDLGGQINLLGQAHLKRDNAGGAALTTMGRTHWLAKLKHVRETTGIGDDVSNLTLGTMIMGGGHQAQADMAMILGIGKVTYGRSGLVSLGKEFDPEIEASLRSMGDNPAAKALLESRDYGNLKMVSSKFRDQYRDMNQLLSKAATLRRKDKGLTEDQITAKLVKEGSNPMLAAVAAKYAITGNMKMVQEGRMAAVAGEISKNIGDSGSIIQQLKQAGFEPSDQMDILRKGVMGTDSEKEEAIVSLATSGVFSGDSNKIRAALESSETKTLVKKMEGVTYKNDTTDKGVPAGEIDQLISLIQQQVVVLRSIKDYRTGKGKKYSS